MIVTLSFEEGLAAVVQGAVQMMRATKNGQVGYDHGGRSGRSIRERWAQAIHGQMCEHAAAKVMDRYAIASVAGIHGDDPGGVAIRGTPWNDGSLIVNESEMPSKGRTTFVLVTGHWPQFNVVGWILGEDACRDEWWRENEKPPSWWVPQSELMEIETLTSRMNT